MSAFKDAVLKDVKSVFINENEFAEEHELNGQKVVCMVDKDITLGKSDTVANPLEGVFVNTITIYVAERDMETQPVEGEQIKLDKVRYMVRNVSVECGVFVIIAEVNEQ